MCLFIENYVPPEPKLKIEEYLHESSVTREVVNLLICLINMLMANEIFGNFIDSQANSRVGVKKRRKRLLLDPKNAKKREYPCSLAHFQR
jgi:hypothetical protein